MPVKIFFCYAHEDEILLKRLKMHLRPLQREGLIEIWHDRDISAGVEWEQEIEKHLNEAQIILLLISPDFMNSDYCYGIEMKRALERHERGEACVIPIILEHVYWQIKPLRKLQALPKDAKPVTSASWHTLNEALYDVVEGILNAAKEVNRVITSDTSKRQDHAVDQLWYTWSDIGLDSIRAGFRIRAASEGLRDIYSECVHELDRYERYLLPLDIDRFAITPSMAPICLALIATSHGRILVHKAYTGNDAFGRPGVFFIHLLASLPESRVFSPMDAILLWKSPFWQVSDAILDRRSTDLDRVSVASLKQMCKDLPIKPSGAALVRKYLPYVIQAYLTKKPLIEEKTLQTVPQKLYIAAPDDIIAGLISGLTHCLPKQLLKDLTFSTYEHDISDATTEIVGTCWLSVQRPEQDPHAGNLLPVEYYQDKLAINCYTGRVSALEDNPLVENNPLAAQFAQEAAQKFMRGDRDDLEELLNEADEDLHLDANSFLHLYYKLVLTARNPSKLDIEDVLQIHEKSLSCTDYEYSAKIFSRPGYQNALIDLVVREPDWWFTNGRKATINLRRQSAKVPMLAQTLSWLSQSTITRFVESVKRDVGRVKATSQAVTNEEATYKNLIDLMYCATPPEADPEVWIFLLHQLAGIKNVFAFILKYWSLYAYLMKLWSGILPLTQESNLKLLSLLSLTWDEFGEFLTLRLPPSWNEIVTNAVVSQSSSELSEDIVHRLEQKYQSLIEDLLLQLSQDFQWWSTAVALFDKLAAGKYRGKGHLLFILLDSEMGKNEENTERLLKTAQLAPVEIALFLERYGPIYISLSPKMEHTIMEMFITLVNNGAHREKMRVLFAWLDSPLLSPWLDSSQKGEKNLEILLEAANLNDEETATFLLRYGQKYIPLFPQSSILIILFNRYAESGGEQRLPLLQVWLNQTLKRTTFEKVLQIARLTPDEKSWFLETYGEHYIRLCPQSQLLLDYVAEYIKYLQNSNFDVFKQSTSPQEPSVREKFLRFLSNTSLSLPKQLIQVWCTVGELVRMPAIMKEKREEVVESMVRLLKSSQLEEEKRSKLITQFAVSIIFCIDDVDGLMSVMPSMLKVLTDEEVCQMLYDLAASVRDGIRQKQYPKAYYLPCILFVFRFKTVYYNHAEQVEYYVQNFLDTLLQSVDKKTLNWLNREAKKWPVSVYNQWQRYVSQRSFPSGIVTPSWLESIKVWLQRLTKFQGGG